MNLSNFTQTEGYPLNAERLQELQNTFQIFSAFGSLAGNLTIISGCETEGVNVKDGFVFINGELLEFRKAAVNQTSTVIIIEEKVSKAFKNGTVKEVYTVRYATFGTSATSWPWTSFIRPIETKAVQEALDKKAPKTTTEDLATRIAELEKKSAVFQAGGGMVLWNKPANQIPAGWQEVTDWQGRMPVGFKSGDPDFGEMGKLAGSRTKTLTVAELPPHSHAYKKAIPGRGYDFQDRTPPYSAYEDAETSIVGQGKAFSILNPYRVVLFIEYIG